MVNINAQLAPAIAAPFHPPTENLQHDNIIKPIIPQTEIISSYSKMREQQEQSAFSGQSRDIVQDENEGNQHSSQQQAQQQQSAAERRRQRFFTSRKELRGGQEMENKPLSPLSDFKLVINAIQARYLKSVSPTPDPKYIYAI